MTLHTESIWRRLKTRLAYHQKLVQENKDRVSMDQCERKIKRLVAILETLNRKAVA